MSELVFVELDKALASDIERLIECAPNPYSCAENQAWWLAAEVYHLLASRNSPSETLMRLIDGANGACTLPAIHMRSHVAEPAGSFVQPSPERGFDYGNSEADRLKRHFHTEWLCWIVSTLLNHEIAVHPSEHGGGQRFHLVSPVPSVDDPLRDVGASTGGGEFQQHADATIHHGLLTREEVEARLSALGTSIEIVAFRLGRSPQSIVEQMLCGRYLRVDATLLGNVIAGTTRTHVGTPRQLQAHLRKRGFAIEQFRRLACMPIAHIAGPADGNISNFVGTVAPPLHLDDEGNIVGTRINTAGGRMRYVGPDPMDDALFERFVHAVRAMPVHRILLRPGDVLFLPNDHFAGQRNVTHGRGRLSDDEYEIDVGGGVVTRRTHVRQYAQSRSRNGNKSFLESTGLRWTANGI